GKSARLCQGALRPRPGEPEGDDPVRPPAGGARGRDRGPRRAASAPRPGDRRGRPGPDQGPVREQAPVPRARGAVRRSRALREAARVVRDERVLLRRTAEIAGDILDRLDERPVFPDASLDEIRAALGGPLPDKPSDPLEVVELLAHEVDKGVVATAGPRYFG